MYAKEKSRKHPLYTHTHPLNLLEIYHNNSTFSKGFSMKKCFLILLLKQQKWNALSNNVTLKCLVAFISVTLRS